MLTAGTTAHGASNDLRGIPAVARAHDAHLHVDAARASGAPPAAEGKALLRDIELADSMTIDLHKSLGCATAAAEFSTRHVRGYLHMDCLFVHEGCRGGGSMLALLVALRSMPSPAPRALRWLCSWGRLSYEIYLRHMFVVFAIMGLYRWSGADPRSGFLWYGPAFVLCWGAGSARCVLAVAAVRALVASALVARGARHRADGLQPGGSAPGGAGPLTRYPH